MARKYWINRFPVCAIVYKEAAELIGYDPGEAKSLGLSRAIFFAAAKRGFKGAGGKKYRKFESEFEKQQLKLKGYDTDSVESLNFCGIGTYVIHTEDGAVRGFIGGQVITPEQYDSQVIDRCIINGGEDGYRKLRLFIRTLLSKLTRAELNSGVVYKVYEKIRDTVRASEFLLIEEKNDGVESEKREGNNMVPAKADNYFTAEH